ncbi:hypothetical protein E4U45_007155 [Claviceps purpurea]|nr:hypothetical protein E4U45_007155 [Claviceps purpurea]
MLKPPNSPTSDFEGQTNGPTHFEQVEIFSRAPERPSLAGMTSNKSFRATMLPASFSFPWLRARSGSDGRANVKADAKADGKAEGKANAKSNTRGFGEKHGKSSFEGPKERRKSPWQKASLYLPKSKKVAPRHPPLEEPLPLPMPLISRPTPSVCSAPRESTGAAASNEATNETNEETDRQIMCMSPHPVHPRLEEQYQSFQARQAQETRQRQQAESADNARASSHIADLSFPRPPRSPRPSLPSLPPLVVSPPPRSPLPPLPPFPPNQRRSATMSPPQTPPLCASASPRLQNPDHQSPATGPPEIPEFSFYDSSHDPPKTLTPEKQRAKLTKPEPVAAQAEAPRSSAADADSEVEPASHGKLHKEQDKPRLRTSSLLPPKREDSPPNEASASLLLPAPELRGRRSVSAQASLTPSPSLPQVRAASPQNGSQSPTRGRRRRSWLPGSGAAVRSRSSSVEVGQKHTPEAWIMSDGAQPEYNPVLLKNAEKVPELWNDNGNVYVYLYPRSAGCGPSFKIPEFVVGESYVFNELIIAEEDAAATDRTTKSGGGYDGLSQSHSPPTPPTSTASVVDDDAHALRLYLPAAPPTASAQLSTPGQGAQAELDRLIAVRNLFAFLTGQPLVGTKARPTMFNAFVEIATLLEEFGFSSPDGTSFGQAVDLSFGFYSEQLALSDCRPSRRKTVEALILGERMRCVTLYNEAFAHAAGKYSAIVALQPTLFDQLTPITRQRLERAHLDLVSRQQNVNEHLEQFEFPSLFAGIASSTSIPELRQVRFKTWRNSFGKMRHFVSSYYRSNFGSWPPKASNKKNPFVESGLNRLVLKELYSDMCALYDLLVDRNNLTSRVMDEVPAISDAPSKMTTSALRNMLSEFDRSRPPVLPPIPFDLPQLPSMKAIHETFDSMSIKDQNKMEKRIKEHELILILNKAYNFDTNRATLPFLDQFKEFEIREGRGKVTQDLVDQRIGYWLFLYAVIQSLPMLVVDAPGVTHTEGVEYFLCEPPMGNLPWVEDGQVRKMWYEVTGGGGIVELSADAVMFSVEATYHRSHCWHAAKQWEGLEEAAHEEAYVDAYNERYHEPSFGSPVNESPMSPWQTPSSPMFPGSERSSPPLGTPSSPGIRSGTPSPPLPPGGPTPALRLPNASLSPPPRSRQISRSSIAMGLEPVPMEPPPNVFGSHNRSSSMGGSRPMSIQGLPGRSMGWRNSSVGNLVAPTAITRGGSPAPVGAKPAATSGVTFDDILGESQKKPAVVAKKKGRFF